MNTPKNDVDAWAEALRQGRTVPFRFSRGKTVLFIFLCLFFALIGLLMIGADGFFIPIVGVLAVFLFLGGAIVLVRRLFRRAAVLEVSTEGIAMSTAKAGTVPWTEIIDVHPVKMNSNVFIEIVVSEQEAERQAAAGHTVAEQELEDGTRQQVLWAPNGLAVSKPALCSWLEQELTARRTV
ncbi:hypothetical protein CFK39_14530 [Brachybacterium avium]|uniref:DUF3093 domain-containing protein n=1 Tax=Brachybacterium avium TaxID=2017485 RepID=A0A220UGG9_9MICO|nr:STM3941 family protein [Brachybacterium avium]ASK66823.1 hypothetical protein CFK39_14530 [Brachybacterium avium]